MKIKKQPKTKVDSDTSFKYPDCACEGKLKNATHSKYSCTQLNGNLGIMKAGNPENIKITYE